MDTIRINRRNTKMVAHRGLSGLERENSCPAFIAASHRDYYGIETDTHVTVDGKYVVIHDNRTGRVAPVDIPVESSTYNDLRSVLLYDMDNKERVDLHIPSLEEYIKICARYGKVGVLELKSAFTPEQIGEILEMVKNLYSLEAITFISFIYENLVYVRQQSEEATVQFLTSNEIDDELLGKLKAYNMDLDVYYQRLTKEWLDKLHEEGIEVNVWTVDNPEDAERLTEWGVDYITSNILQ